MAMTIAEGFLPSAQLWLTKILIDTAAEAFRTDNPGLFTRLLFLVILQAVLVFLISLLDMMRSTIAARLGELLRNHINLQVLQKANRFDVPFFEDSHFYDKLHNAYSEVGDRPLQIVAQLSISIQSIIALFSVTLLLAKVHWIITVVTLISTVPALLVQAHYGQRNYSMLRERAPAFRKQHYFGMLLTSDWFIKEIRAFGLEDHFLKCYRSFFDRFYVENCSLISMRNRGSALAMAASGLGWFLSASFVIVQAAQRTVTIGDIFLCIQAISAAQAQSQSVLSGLASLYSNTLFLRNLFEFVALPTRDQSAGLHWSEPIEEIEFRNVSFHYPGTSREALHGISFRIRRGGTLAVVGNNGAGKSTLVKLIARLYQPTSGDILINGKNLSEYSPRSVQEQVSVLFQDYGHYCITARENIGIGMVSNISDSRAIEAASKASGANELIEKLPDKYDTILGKWFDGGVQLSGGEWQKIALARAVLRRGRILILDEPTASLDAQSAHNTLQGLLQERSDRITVFVTHRFSSVRTADQILYLEAGRCVESGSHSDLMASCGKYANLFRLQASEYYSGFLTAQ